MSGALTQAPAEATAIGAEEFAALLTGFTGLSDKIAIAVSGGPDSIALAFCLKRWGQRDIVAFIVDHGLRPEAAAEAASVQKQLQHMGITAEILSWEHAGVSGRLHEKARAARYRLLTQACHAHHIRDLFIAHHRDDQAETVLMRIAKGSGIEGLAGIAPQTARDDIRLLRPLLNIGKDRLIATCVVHHIDSVRDPSNQSEKYARGRLRKILPLLANEGLTVENLTLLASRAADVKETLDIYTEIFLKSAAHCEQGGHIRLNRQNLRETPRAIGLRGLTACLRYIHDDDYPPEYSALLSLWQALTDTQTDITRTLYGNVIYTSETEIHFIRETSAANEILPVTLNQPILWDNRWMVTLQASAPFSTLPNLTLCALGNPTHAEIDALAPDLRHAIPQGRIRACLPALWSNNKLCAIPSFNPDAAFTLHYRKRSFP